MKKVLGILIIAGMTSVLNARPEVIAHRGASGYVVEHTAPAKAMAHAMGADYIEQDVVLSKDGVPVVMHDVYLDDMTDVAEKFPDRKDPETGRYYAADLTLAELKTLHLTERRRLKTGEQVFPGRFPSGKGNFRIMTLREELELIQGLNKSCGREAGIYPEIKSPSWHRKRGLDVSKATLEVLREFGYEDKEDKCWVQCFEFEEVKRIRGELGWSGKLLMLISARKTPSKDGTDYVYLRSDTGLKELSSLVDGIGPDIRLLASGKTPGTRKASDLTKRAHALGLLVHPYTVRVDDLPKWSATVDEMLEFLFQEQQVDAVFTDFPDVVVRKVASLKNK